MGIKRQRVEHLCYYQCKYDRHGSGASCYGFILNQEVVLKPIVPGAASWFFIFLMFAEVAAPWQVSSAVWFQKSHLEGDTAILPAIVKCLSVQIFSATTSGLMQDDRQMVWCSAQPSLTIVQSGENQSSDTAWKLQGSLFGLCVLWWEETPLTLMTKIKWGHIIAYAYR